MTRSKQQSGFTTAQDMSLLAAVKQFDKKWIIVQNRVTGKSAKECEDRYKELEANGMVKETNEDKSLTGSKRSAVNNNLKAIPELSKVNNVDGNIRITKPVSKALESRRIPTTERKIAPRLQSSSRTFAPNTQLPILLPKPKPLEISGSARISSIKTNTKKSSKKKASTSPFKPRPQSQFPSTSPLKIWPELQNPNQFLNFNIFDSNMSLVTPKVGIDENNPITMEKLYQGIEFPPAPQQDKPRAKTYTTPIKVPAQTQNFDELFEVNDLADTQAYSGRLDHALIPAMQLENSKIFSKSDLDLDEFVLVPKRKKGIPDLTSDNFFDDDLVGDEYLDEFLYIADNNDKDDESEVEEDIPSIID